MPAGTLESCAPTLTTTVSPTVASQDMCEQCKTSCSSNTSSILEATQDQLSGNKSSNNSGKKRFTLIARVHLHPGNRDKAYTFFHEFLASLKTVCR